MTTTEHSRDEEFRFNDSLIYPDPKIELRCCKCDKLLEVVYMSGAFIQHYEEKHMHGITPFGKPSYICGLCIKTELENSE